MDTDEQEIVSEGKNRVKSLHYEICIKFLEEMWQEKSRNNVIHNKTLNKEVYRKNNNAKEKWLQEKYDKLNDLCFQHKHREIPAKVEEAAISGDLRNNCQLLTSTMYLMHIVKLFSGTCPSISPEIVAIYCSR